MQESFYESGNCVQIICAIQGVHPSDFSPTSVQLKSEINGECSCKRHQRQHLEFSTTLFGTRRTVVQIHSPRPTLLELTTYNTRKSERPHGAAPGARWYKSVRHDHSPSESIRERQNTNGTNIYIGMNSLWRECSSRTKKEHRINLAPNFRPRCVVNVPENDSLSPFPSTQFLFGGECII